MSSTASKASSSIWTTLIGWGEDLEAFLGSFVQSEVNDVTPLAEQAVAELTTEEAAALTTGNAANTGHILAAVVASTATKAAAASLTASPASLAGAVGAAVAKATTNAAKAS